MFGLRRLLQQKTPDNGKTNLFNTRQKKMQLKNKMALEEKVLIKYPKR